MSVLRDANIALLTCTRYVRKVLMRLGSQEKSGNSKIGQGRREKLENSASQFRNRQKMGIAGEI